MSSASVKSNKREKETTELSEELESIRAMNNSLQAYLDHLRTFKKNLISINNNCKQLSKVNQKWIETVSVKK